MARARRDPGGIHPLGVTIALTFIGLPFVIRTVQPVLEGSTRPGGGGRGARRVALADLPARPAPRHRARRVTGFALSFARGLGEYGSVVFISGSMPMRTEIAPLLIMTRLEQFDYAGAAALAMVLLGASFVLLVAINRLQAWTRPAWGSMIAPARARRDGADARARRRRAAASARAPQARARPCGAAAPSRSPPRTRPPCGGPSWPSRSCSSRASCSCLTTILGEALGGGVRWWKALEGPTRSRP